VNVIRVVSSPCTSSETAADIVLATDVCVCVCVCAMITCLLFVLKEVEG
jgi:hypothetical protein